MISILHFGFVKINYTCVMFAAFGQPSLHVIIIVTLYIVENKWKCF